MDAEFVAEAPQGTVPIPPAVPPMQPMFQQGVQGILYPVAVIFYAKEGGYQNTTFQISSTSHQRGPSQQRPQYRVHMRDRRGRSEVRRPIRCGMGAIIPALMHRIPLELRS